ncbi:MAG: ABC transporter ATP-binding protein [Chitinophagales bacterium]
MARKALIRCEQLSKVYNMGEVSVQALDEVSLEIYENELLVILGPSGSGKSTLLNILGGMDLPTFGEVIFREENLSRANEARLTAYRRREVGFVFQFFNLIPDLTARENVEMAAHLVEHPLSSLQVLKGVELGDRADHFPSQLSGGEQQRVSIARALVKNPRLLLCDEPTGALDYQTGKLILGLLAEVSREGRGAVVIVTHNSAIAEMADRVIRMRSGKIAEISINSAPVSPERIEW